MVLMLCPFFYNSAVADELSVSKNKDVVTTRAENKAALKKYNARLKEIKILATTTQLSLSEKKELRKEVQNIKEQLQKMEGVYLYLSLTAILIILLLIILL